MNNEEIVKKLTEAIAISDKASIWNPSHDKDNPDMGQAVHLMDDIIVDIIMAINPDWKRPN